MSIPVNPPAVWSNNQLIAPEKLNRNMFAAKTQLEDWAELQWHRWTIATGVPVNDVVALLPAFLVTGFVYYVERIIMYGAYTGQPVLSWGYGAQPPVGSYTLPLDGTNEVTVLPGNFIFTGGTNFYIKLTGAGGTGMRSVIGLRASRVPASTPAFTSDLTIWGEGDALDPAKFNTQLTTLSTFGNTWSQASALRPFGVELVEFRNFTNASSSFGLTDQLLGSGDEKVTQIVCNVEMATVGLPGQIVSLFGGYGVLNFLASGSVAGVSTASFTTGLTSITDLNRVPSVASDDFNLNVSTNGANPVARVQIFILKSRP